jgi:hypothetical protein
LCRGVLASVTARSLNNVAGINASAVFAPALDLTRQRAFAAATTMNPLPVFFGA